jgi:splicing factor U2AF subunit
MFFDLSLNLRRPKDYTGIDATGAIPAPPVLGAPVVIMPSIMPQFGLAGERTTVPDGPNKLAITGLPILLDDTMVRELLTQIGEVAHFDLLKGPDGASRGIAFCEFADPLNTDVAISGLHGMQISESNTLTVARVAARPVLLLPGITGMGAPPPQPVMSTAALGSVASSLSGAVTSSRILVLLNMVTMEDLADADEYADINEDVRAEADKFGRVLSMEIPRSGPGAGKVLQKPLCLLSLPGGIDNLPTSQRSTWSTKTSKAQSVRSEH